MAVNLDKPERWKADIAQSVDLFNEWFLDFAPRAYRDTRIDTTSQVQLAFELTANLTNITPSALRDNPFVLPILRMATAPPIARDRLIGLAKVPQNLVKSMEIDSQVPARMGEAELISELTRIGEMIARLADRDVLPWLESGNRPTTAELQRAATIVADRLCGTVADPIIRNAQEQRQFAVIRHWLEERGYSIVPPRQVLASDQMQPGTYAFHLTIPAQLVDETQVNVPIDVAIKPVNSKVPGLPVLVEAKSAGDFTNVNKRRKEEADKVSNLRRSYAGDCLYVLFLGGYFNPGYLGYEAAEGINWVWEHRVGDLAEFGV